MQILRFALQKLSKGSPTAVNAQNDRFSREFPWACGPPEEMKIGPGPWCTIYQAWNGEGRPSLWMSRDRERVWPGTSVLNP